MLKDNDKLTITKKELEIFIDESMRKYYINRSTASNHIYSMMHKSLTEYIMSEIDLNKEKFNG